jgi:phosphoglucosamine mutase
LNINEACGAVHPQMMADAVVAHGADAGICLDGDADRLIMADETGAIIDGDQILGRLALALHQKDELNGGGVVGTVMSNRGLELALRDAGLTLHRANVGDRYILEMMRSGGFNLGGEPSGHILMTHLARSGDGLLAALQMLALMQQAEQPASQFFNCFVPSPQRLENLRDIDPNILHNEKLQADLAAIETDMKGGGRVLVRPSGTEALIRVMVEADSDALLTRTMDALILRIQQESKTK